ncbi:MarR family transcriptional regulator [Parabacteroides distasonis]|uniref:MarR family transcriptional regulator n=1 Tax=Parabacteroides distasonis TaxID=823 RepID=UPI0021D3CFFD|nr:MarR family transcriptional regulator [Parabacteroides distasonis]
MREEPTIRQIDLANRLDLTEQYIRKLIKKLKEHGWIERIGAKKNGYWKIIEKP